MYNISAHNGYLAILTQYGMVVGGLILYFILSKSLLVFNYFRTSKKIEKTFANSDVYEVLNSPSETLSNEKNSIKNITKQISEDITNFINFYYKD